MSSGDGHPDAVTNEEERHALGLPHGECLICRNDELQVKLGEARREGRTCPFCSQLCDSQHDLRGHLILVHGAR